MPPRPNDTHDSAPWVGRILTALAANAIGLGPAFWLEAPTWTIPVLCVPAFGWVAWREYGTRPTRNGVALWSVALAAVLVLASALVPPRFWFLLGVTFVLSVPLVTSRTARTKQVARSTPGSSLGP